MLVHKKDIQDMSNAEIISFAIREKDITVAYIKEYYDVPKLKHEVTVQHSLLTNILSEFKNNTIYSIEEIIFIFKSSGFTEFKFLAGEWDDWPTMNGFKKKEIVQTDDQVIKKLQIKLKKQVATAYKEQTEYANYLKLKAKWE